MELSEILSHPGKRLIDHIGRIEAFDGDRLFILAAKFHDLGKCTESFQCYIRNKSDSADPHAGVSALAFLLANADRLSSKELLMISDAIFSHHTPLKSRKKLAETLSVQMGWSWNLWQRQYAELLANEEVERWWNLPRMNEELLEDLGFDFNELRMGLEDFIHQKLLYSKLIFADKYEAITSKTFHPPALKCSVEDLEHYKKKKGFDTKSFRSKAAHHIVRHWKEDPQRVVTITAPTGAGKTLASLELALTIAKKEGKKRIIYAIPFTSIIDQTVAIFSEISSGGVTAHHYRVAYPEMDEEGHNDYDRIKYLVESWSHPFIVTTFYQLFFALFSEHNSDNIKFQSLRNSVVVLDEVQAIPFELWKVMQQLFEPLAKILDTVFVLMSATMPIVVRNVPELANKKMLFRSKNRYILKWIDLKESDEERKLEELAREVIDAADRGRSVLCVVNTIKNAKRLFGRLKEDIEEERLYALNSYMLPVDREKTLSALRTKTSNRVEEKVLISTQVVEAGVDLDFDIGFRELAPLSSIIQTAGRVNREGMRGQAEVKIFNRLGYEIYDSSLMSATRNHLLAALRKCNGIEEQQILKLVESFFATLDLILSDRYEILKAIEKFDFPKIGDALRKIFRLEDDYTDSVVLGVDLREMERRYFELEKELGRWELKHAKEKMFKSFLPHILNIKKRDIAKSGVVFKKSNLFGLLYLEEYHGIYSEKTGFLIEEEQGIEGVFELF